MTCRKHRALAPALRAALILLVSAFGPARGASAQDESTQRRAAEAYDQGIAAFRAGEYARAGESFVRANVLAPSPIALAQAVRAFREANQIRVAGTLALRLLAQEGLPPLLRQIAERAVADATQWYVRIDVACAVPCTVAVDGVIEESSRFFAPPDRDLRITARFRSGATMEETVRAPAGEARLVSFAALEGEGGVEPTPVNVPLDPGAFETAALERGENPYRISRNRYFSRPRATFFAVLGPTVVGIGMVTWSGLDTRRSREALRALGPAATAEEIARAEVEHERDARRTKWLAVEEAGFLGATALIAALTDWTPYGDDGESTTEARLSVSPSGFSASLQHEF